ncbi:hypothetical protein [Streptomyces angustmyceticus]|uniref:hypothetical protein n=1 Tax=Streptomyces angustmyceticus TaxID=285578 RepID=UPI003D8C60D2
MAQTKFDKQLEREADSLVRGIGRVLAGRDLDGVKRTDATFWHAGTRVLPKVEGKVRRRSYKPGWRRLSFRVAPGAGVAESGYLATQDLDATSEALQELWDNRETALAALEPGKNLYGPVGVMFGKFYAGAEETTAAGNRIPAAPASFLPVRAAVRRRDPRFLRATPDLAAALAAAGDDGRDVFEHIPTEWKEIRTWAQHLLPPAKPSPSWPDAPANPP